VSSKSTDLKWIEEIDPFSPNNFSFFTGKSGSHRDNGIFLAEGPGVRSGLTVDGAHIMDVAPTILHVLGVPVPADMDGRVLVDVLEGEAAEGVAIGAAVADIPVQEAGLEENYTEADKLVIAERLRALGYID
jgi:arylsulfatase A-like enzyme